MYDADSEESGFVLHSSGVTKSTASNWILSFGLFVFFGSGFIYNIIFMMFIIEKKLQLKDHFDLFEWALILVILMTFFFEFIQMCITGYHVGNVGGALFLKILCIYLSPLVFHAAHSIYTWRQFKSGVYEHDLTPIHIKIAAITVFIQVLFSSFLPAFLLFLVYPVKVISLIAYNYYSFILFHYNLWFNFETFCT